MQSKVYKQWAEEVLNDENNKLSQESIEKLKLLIDEIDKGISSDDLVAYIIRMMATISEIKNWFDDWPDL